MKQLRYKNDTYYYQYIDAEDGTPIYADDEAGLKYRDENCIPYTKLGNWEYDDWTAQEDFEMLVNELDEAKEATEARRFAPVKIDGSLGLWDGKHKIQPVEEPSWDRAIRRCLNNMDSFEIYQSGKYTIYIDAHHHDGTNRFKLTCYC